MSHTKAIARESQFGMTVFYEGLIKHQVGDSDFEFKNALDLMNPKDSVMNSK